MMTVLLRFVGSEIGGGIVGGVASALAGWPEATVYAFAKAGAAVGASLSFLIVKSLPVRDAALMQPLPPPPAFG